MNLILKELKTLKDSVKRMEKEQKQNFDISKSKYQVAQICSSIQSELWVKVAKEFCCSMEREMGDQEYAVRTTLTPRLQCYYY